MFLPCFDQQNKPAKERKNNSALRKKNYSLKPNLLIFSLSQNCIW